MAALQGYTIRLYKELEAITGMSCGLHHVGGITLADNTARFEQLKAERAKHRYMGLDTEILGPEEIHKLTDGMVNLEGIIGALYDPLDGHLDPSGTTHAYAKAAKMAQHGEIGCTRQMDGQVFLAVPFLKHVDAARIGRAGRPSIVAAAFFGQGRLNMRLGT
jgi:glycine/D-amino acid oxidase-like deaminating enzyme